MNKNIIIAAVVAACSAFAQDAPPAAPGMPGCPKGKPAPEMKRGFCRQGQKRGCEGRRINPGIMIIGEELVMAKYDADKDGKLSDEELNTLRADVQKAGEAKKAAILKKFDKDGDGKLSDEEKKAMREEWAKDHPEAAKRMEEMKAAREARMAEMLKKFDKDGDGKLSLDELKDMPPMPAPRQAGRRGDGPKDCGCPGMRGPRDGKGPHHGDMGRRPRPEGPLPDGGRMNGPRPEGFCPARPEGMDKPGPRGDRRGPAPRPMIDPKQAPMMMAGWILVEEKYDADKDGKLSEQEMTQLKADADKALQARREARKGACPGAGMPPMEDEGDNPPPPPAPEEGAAE